MLIKESSLRRYIRKIIFETHQFESDINHEKIKDTLADTIYMHCDNKFPKNNDTENIDIASEFFSELFYINGEVRENNRSGQANLDKAHEIVIDVIEKHFTGMPIDSDGLDRDCERVAPAIMNAIAKTDSYKEHLEGFKRQTNAQRLQDFASGSMENEVSIHEKIKNLMLKDMTQEEISELGPKIDNLVKHAVNEYEAEVEDGTDPDLALESALDYLKSFYEF